MRTVLSFATVFALAASAQAALGAEPPSVRFQHNDWELACDNTRTCRAAGYHAEEGENAPVTVLLERRAGPGTPFSGRLWLGDVPDAVDNPGSVTMSVDGRVLGAVSAGCWAGIPLGGLLGGLGASALGITTVFGLVLALYTLVAVLPLLGRTWRGMERPDAAAR